MYIFFPPAEFVKNALKHLRTPKDTSPAVKISGPVPPMQQALCVCVLKADPVAAIPSPYPATTPPPHPTHKATLCEVRLCCRYQKGCKCSCGHSARPSNCCHVTGTMCSPLLWELCFTVQEGARSYWDSKEINRIDSSLEEITLAFALYQILFCPKGCLPARQPHFKLYYSRVKEVSGSKQQSDGKSP